MNSVTDGTLMKLLASAALLLLPFTAMAEEAAALAVEQASPFGVVAFFAAVVAAGVWFFIAMNKSSGKTAQEKNAEDK